MIVVVTADDGITQVRLEKGRYFSADEYMLLSVYDESHDLVAVFASGRWSRAVLVEEDKAPVTEVSQTEELTVADLSAMRASLVAKARASSMDRAASS